jgi:DNA-binding transcriptional ArsR family regulator
LRKKFERAQKPKKGKELEVYGVDKISKGESAKPNRQKDAAIEVEGFVNVSKVLQSDEKTNFQKKIDAVIEVLKALAEKRVTMKQLNFLPKIEENEGLLYYQLVDKLSQEQKLPKSTVRWNLTKLRQTGLIVAGDRKNKGVLVELTEKGRIALSAISKRREEFMGNFFCPKPLSDVKPPVYNGSRVQTKNKHGEKSALKNAKSKAEEDYSKEKLELSFWYETRPEGP